MRISDWSSDVCSSDLALTLTNECQRGMVVRATGEQHQQNASDIESRDPEGWQHEKQAISNGMGCHQSSTGPQCRRPLSCENDFGNEVERDIDRDGPNCGLQGLEEIGSAS